jgi:hypothetical protein
MAEEFHARGGPDCRKEMAEAEREKWVGRVINAHGGSRR